MDDVNCSLIFNLMVFTAKSSGSINPTSNGGPEEKYCHAIDGHTDGGQS